MCVQKGSRVLSCGIMRKTSRPTPQTFSFCKNVFSHKMIKGLLKRLLKWVPGSSQAKPVQNGRRLVPVESRQRRWQGRPREVGQDHRCPPATRASSRHCGRRPHRSKFPTYRLSLRHFTPKFGNVSLGSSSVIKQNVAWWMNLELAHHAKFHTLTIYLVKDHAQTLNPD